MKHLTWIAALLLVLSACGKEDPQPVADEQPVAAEEAAPETRVEETVDEAVEETQEVVEESAAVEEVDEDEAIVLALADTEVPAR